MVDDGEGVGTGGGGEEEFVAEGGFTDVTAVQVPPECGVGAMMSHAENDSFHLT